MSMCVLSWAVAFAAQAGGSGGGGAASGGGSDQWSYAIAAGLLLAGVLLLFVEVFVPSGGIIGSVALLSLISGVVMCFRIDTTLGLVSAIVAVGALPVVVALGIKMAPETPVFRMLALKASQAPVVGSMASAGLEKARRKGGASSEEGASSASSSRVGRVGEAVTDLRPVGTCVIDGKREECLASSGVIERGQAVEVVSEDGMEIKVRVRGES